MKKITKKFLAILCGVLIALPVFAACDNTETPPDTGKNPPVTDEVDYVSALHLDMNSNTKKQEVTVKFYIDGDTTHFNPTSNSSDFLYGYIQARYLAVNTPESTGKIEKWGKQASNFTHATLAGAESIIVESDDDKWNFDSTGERLLLWVWYKPKGGTEYRNLNIELLQNGYGRSSKTDDNRYGETASAALYQAQMLKLRVYGNEKDPLFFEGAAEPMSLKYLRFHIEDYVDRPVRVNGYITARYSSSVYIEEYDEELGCSFGIAVYYGFKTGELLDILQVGNTVNVVGKVTAFNGTYQISDVEHNAVRPNLPTNTTLVPEGTIVPHEPFSAVNAADLQLDSDRTLSAQFSLGENEDGEEQFETKTINYNAGIMDTSATLTDLTITDLWTTKKGDSAGAMTITCTDANGNEIAIRTQVLKKADGSLYTEADIGKIGDKIKSVKGIIDYYEQTDDDGNVIERSYQLAVWNFSCFTFE